MDSDSERIAQAERLLPRQRGNVRVSNHQVLAALLHVQRHDCAWRQLPESFGNWHTIYTRVRRWSDRGILKAVERALAAAPAEAARPAARAGAAIDPAAAAALAEAMRPLTFMLYSHLKQERQRHRGSQLEVATMMAIESGGSDSERISALAHRLEVQPQTMSVTIRRLAAEGWIGTAGPLRGDKRSVGLTVTPAGRRVLAQVRAGRSDQLVRQFSKLDAPSFDALRAALPTLNKIANGLSQALPRR